MIFSAESVALDIKATGTGTDTNIKISSMDKKNTKDSVSNKPAEIKIFGESSLPMPTNKPYIPPPNESEANSNIDRIFFEKLDPESILKDVYPETVDIKDIQKADEDFETYGLKYSMNQTKISIPGYLFKDQKIGLGTVMGGIDGEEILGPKSRIVVKVNDRLKIGSIYSVVRFVKKIKDLDNPFVYWKFHKAVGTILLKKFVSHDKYVIGITLDNTAIMKDDILIPYFETEKIMDTKLAFVEKVMKPARVVSFMMDTADYAGSGSLILINRGKNDGLKENQILNVYMDSVLRELKVPDLSPIGTVQLVEVLPSSSVAFVRNCRNELRIGDFVYSP